MDFIKISIIILVSVITVNCLPVFEKSITSTINITAVLVVIWIVISTITPIVSDIKGLFDKYINGDLSVVFKSLGISLITQFVADIAVDNGNKSLANLMVLTGKLAIIVLAMPIYLQVLELVGQILK